MMFSKEIQLNLLTNALEGGSNYWYVLKNISQVEPGDSPLVERIFAALMAGKEFKVRDIESNELLGVLSKKSMNEAGVLMMQKFPQHFKNVKNDNDDAETADVWFQLAVMKELIFG